MTLWKIHSSFSSDSVISCLLKIHLSHLLFIQSLPHFLSKEERYKNHESFSKCQAYVVCIVLKVHIIWTLPFDFLTDNITFRVSEFISCSSQDWLVLRRASSLIFSIALLDESQNENRWQLFKLPQGKNAIICRLPIQNKFGSILLKWHD